LLQSVSAGSLTLTGKATSDSTLDADAATTLTTKDYVDGKTGTVDNSLTAGAFLNGDPYNGSQAVTFNVDATTDNQPSKVVVRDTLGNFSANVITAAEFAGPATSALTATDCSRIVTAGDGLVGGGELNANITIDVDTTVLRTSGTQTLDGSLILSDSLLPDVSGSGGLGSATEKWGEIHADELFIDNLAAKSFLGTADTGTDLVFKGRTGAGAFTATIDGAGDALFNAISAASLAATGAITAASVTTTGDITCANLFANDVIMSNMGCEVGNEVDGTQGHWVMQEGEDELFVINRRTGKRYAMSLRPMD